VVKTSLERRESMARWVAAGSLVKVGWLGGPAASWTRGAVRASEFCSPPLSAA
jgi:hypothetical protein